MLTIFAEWGLVLFFNSYNCKTYSVGEIKACIIHNANCELVYIPPNGIEMRRQLTNLHAAIRRLISYFGEVNLHSTVSLV